MQNNKTIEFNEDSGLTDVLDLAGIPVKYADIGNGILIDDGTALELYIQSKLIQKIINKIPEAATEKPFSFDLGESSGEGVDIYSELDKIPCYLHRNGFKELSYGINYIFKEADQIARLYGDSFLLISVDDGQSPDQPVNINNIKSIEYLYLLSHHQLMPDGTNNHYFYTYNINAPDNLKEVHYIHPDRVLRFYGCQMPSGINIGTYRNYSILQACYESFVRMSGSVGSAHDMLQKHSAFIYAIKGFRDVAISTDTNKKNDFFKSVFKGVLDGIGRMGGVLMDSESTANFINRNYGGVDTLVNLIMDIFIAHSDLPRSILLGSSNSSAFSEGGLSDRIEFANSVRIYQNNNYKPKLKVLGNYYLLSKQSVVKKIDKWDVSFPSILALTPKEQAELEKLYAESDTIRIRDGVLTENEIRQSRYSGTTFGTNITLDPNVTSDLIEQRRQEKMASQKIINQQTNQPQIKADASPKLVFNGRVLPLSEYEYYLESDNLENVEEQKTND